MYPSAQENVPSALHLSEISTPKRPPSPEAVPSSFESPPMSPAPPPVYSSHGFEPPFPEPTTTTTEGYGHDTESGTSTKPPGLKKRICLALFISLLALCILATGIGIFYWIYTIERREVALLAHKQGLEQTNPGTSSNQLQQQTPTQTETQTDNWLFLDIENPLGLLNDIW